MLRLVMDEAGFDLYMENVKQRKRDKLCKILKDAGIEVTDLRIAYQGNFIAVTFGNYIGMAKRASFEIFDLQIGFPICISRLCEDILRVKENTE